jgi:dethiobiotin synthetase
MALRNAGCDVIGVAFVGDPEPEVEQTIAQMCKTRNLGRLPYLPDLTRENLADAFQTIDLDTIRRAL